MWLNVWNYIVGWVRQESAAATALVQAFIALGIAFSWWHWSAAQTGAVVGIAAALLGMFVRSQVRPLHPLSARMQGGGTARAAAGGTGPGPAGPAAAGPVPGAPPGPPAPAFREPPPVPGPDPWPGAGNAGGQP